MNPLSSTYRSTGQNDRGSESEEEEESQSTSRSNRSSKKRKVEKILPVSKELKSENSTQQNASGMKIVLNLKQSQQQLLSTSCKSIITSLMRNRNSYPFLEPVDPIKLGIPSYFDIIKHPMDLGTILSNINTNSYSNVNQFIDDVRLVFFNATTFNPPGNS